MQSNGRTTIQFTRKLNTSDSYDYAINTQPFYLTAAISPMDGFGSVYGKHTETAYALVSFAAVNGSAVVTTTVAPTNNSAAVNISHANLPGYTSPAGDFKAWWLVSGPNITITMWASVTGWLSFGIAQTPFMPASDVYTVCSLGSLAHIIA